MKYNIVLRLCLTRKMLKNQFIFRTGMCMHCTVIIKRLLVRMVTYYYCYTFINVAAE